MTAQHPSQHRPQRGGFTLIELLVVIAIIAVLIALLLPAVQQSREAARRAQCLNNLMQINIALQTYESAYEVLPPGVVDAAKGPILNAPKGYHMGWLVQLLPFVEEKVAFKAVDFSRGLYHPANDTVRDHGVALFLCPSDTSTFANAGSNYAACHNDVEAPIDTTNNGVFFLNSSVTKEDIKDGLSYTIFVSERQSESDLGWASGTRSSLRNTGVTPNRNLPVYTAGPAVRVTPGLTPTSVGGFSSFHPGGINCAFGDGSVKFIKNSITAAVFNKLGNRNDGQLVSSSSF